jgi:NadR type nicotinamide-nucleotide adenylyltransferase
MHKIAIVGPESSGKTELCRALSMHFQEPWVEEFAREYLLERDGKYKEVDLWEIAKGQLDLEAKASSRTTNFLFCDTTLLVIQVWAEYKYGHCQSEILKNYKPNDYTLHLLLVPDLNYENDPLRENPGIEEREKLFETYHLKLKSSGANFAIIKGHGEERLKNSLKVLHSQFSF